MLRSGPGKNPPCRPRSPLALLPWLVACGGGAAAGIEPGEGSPGACPAVQLDEPVTRQARVEVIAGGQTTIGTLPPLEEPPLIADASGVYWYDLSGAVFARQHGASSVVALQPGDDADGAPRWQRVAGIAADTDHIYVGQAYLEAASDYFPAQLDPPGRLLSYPKEGGAPQVLLELDDGTIHPFAADGERIIALIVDAEGNGGYFQITPSNPQPQRLAMRLTPGGGLTRRGDTLYWSSHDTPPRLVRTRFDDAAPEVLMPLRGSDFEVGPGYVLSIDGEATQRFVQHQEGSDETRPLPGTGARISPGRAADARHVYWYSYVGYDGSVPLEDYDPDLQLVRLDIQCGVLERIETPGLTPAAATEILGQGPDTLYIASGGNLLAVQKP